MTDRNAMMIAMIAEKAPAAAAALLVMDGVDEKHAEYLAGPMITPMGHDSDIPRSGRLPALIHRQRTERIVEEHSKGLAPELATLAEVALYLSCVSIQGPLPTDWTNVFTYAFQETYKHEINDPWKEIGCEKPIELSNWEKEHLLKKLQRDIRRSIEKELQERRRERRRKAA